ncbi:hypothetical protein Q5425_32035 [Amycolatopsis sp. A133]|uniref:hypothetical protein n=1 Tax=Amycolatopsis sp. A133 TaxID=3064472 RepID=UPI0027F60F60|nr:hypothetical protein [Amycolatopsis sp. A133]MDQ7808388.1 hypothetical protein [Amycolatopsis sp. A133]
MTANNNAVQTYLALRFAMVLLVLLLFLAVVFQLVSISHGPCFQPSISAYYYTAVRPVFVGALCAIGVCLIVYRGNRDTENAVLDYSGFLAFIVAFVPTEIDTRCSPTNGPAPDEIAVAVGNNALAALVVGLAAAGVGWRVKLVRQDPSSPLSASAKAWLGLTVALLACGVTIFFFEREFFLRYGHLCAAVALFVGIAAAVVVNAVDFKKEHEDDEEPPTNRYFLVFGFMVVTVLVCVVFAIGGFSHWVLVLEASLIAEFAVFWLIQTKELGSAPTRAQAP